MVVLDRFVIPDASTKISWLEVNLKSLDRTVSILMVSNALITASVSVVPALVIASARTNLTMSNAAARPLAWSCST